jgi:zona occludens toxin (predicted ATPase)
LTFVIPMPRSETLVLVMALVSLAFNVVYFVLHYRWKYTGKAPANLEVGQSESVL